MYFVAGEESIYDDAIEAAFTVDDVWQVPSKYTDKEVALAMFQDAEYCHSYKRYNVSLMGSLWDGSQSTVVITSGSKGSAGYFEDEYNIKVNLPSFVHYQERAFKRRGQ